MKKVFITIIAVVLVAIAVFFSFKHFRGESADTAPKAPSGAVHDTDSIISKDSLNKPAQDGEATDEAQQFADLLKTTTGMDYNPINITSVGSSIRSGDCAYKVTSWSCSKEYPGYPLPDGKTPLSDYPGAVTDENGNITNEFSYVVVNLEIENLTSEELSNYFWGINQLKAIGSGSGKFSGEVTYLGDDRSGSKDYFFDTIEANGKKEMPLIFVVKDEYLTDNQLYIEVNPSGVADTNPDYDVKRYIFLT